VRWHNLSNSFALYLMLITKLTPSIDFSIILDYEPIEL
jgi:hypothetical protein